MKCNSEQLQLLYDGKVRFYRPDVVLYLESWAEQVAFSQFTEVDRVIAEFMEGSFVKRFYYQSALVTYLVEKYMFVTTTAVKFWKVDVEPVRNTLTHLSDAMADAGGRFVFVTEVSRFPRYYRQIDTFDYRQVEGLLDSLERDPAYVYDAAEISALNQRLVVAYSLEVCRQHDIPAINLLDMIEQLGEQELDAYFTDLVHSTWKLDKLIGEEIAARLTKILWTEEDAAELHREAPLGAGAVSSSPEAR